MSMVRAFPVLVEQLARLPALLPSVAELRPAFCPCCGQPAHPPGGRLGVVGHGTYQRQVLGLHPGEQLVIPVRRYLCRACSSTTAVLPDELHPGRLYCAAAILISLWATLAQKVAARAVREWFGSPGETAGWRAVRRWRTTLLVGLWGGLARQAGCAGGPCDREDGTRRLDRLLGLAGLVSSTCSEADVADVAAWLTRRGGRDRPGHTRSG